MALLILQLLQVALSGQPLSEEGKKKEDEGKGEKAGKDMKDGEEVSTSDKKTATGDCRLLANA